jgi:hypothetical protein
MVGSHKQRAGLFSWADTAKPWIFSCEVTVRSLAPEGLTYAHP